MSTVAITGYGIVSAIGNDAQEVLSSLKEGRSGVDRMQYLKSDHSELPVGEVKMSNAQMKQLLGVGDDQIVSRTALMGALAARQAMLHSHLDIKGRRVAFLSGTTVAGMDITEEHFNQMKTDDTAASLIRHHDCGTSTRESARLAGLDGALTSTISTACSSALNAIILGADMLKSGEADIVVAGGSEALSRFHLNGFNTLMILDKEQCRPFDSTRAGLNLGEGAAYVVMERGDEAKVRGAEIHGWVAGYGNACDAFHQTASSDNGEGAYRSMTAALEMAGLKPSDIHYINAHGTGTPNNDVSESQALVRVFGNDMPPVSSTKSFTGHTTSASGSIETVVCLLAMKEGFVPASLGWKNQADGVITPSLGEEGVQLDNVLCNSFGFGGNDSSLVISKEKPTQALPKGLLSTDKMQMFDTLGKLENRGVKVAGESVIDNPEALKDSRKWISPMEGRRMGKLLKAATMTSLEALQKAGVDCPDAIVTATCWGMIDTSEQFLDDMCTNGEQLLKPTLFMQSTHNTISSAIAIRTGCHGCNVTYSHGRDSWEWAMRHARRLIETGEAMTVLVGVHDEASPLIGDMIRRAGLEPVPEIYSRSVVLRGES